MDYFLGGYYLIKTVPANFGSINGHVIDTCSFCINDSILGYWSLSWTSKNNKGNDEILSSFGVDTKDFERLRKWADDKFDEGQIGWGDLFRDIETAKGYQDNFFSHLDGLKILAIYFSEQQALELIEDFKPQKESQGTIGLSANLKLKIPQNDSEKSIGYDIIGVEHDGNFHSFHCHDLSGQLAEKFNLKINQHGLFDFIPSAEDVSNFMNDEANGFEPVPWYIVKIAQVID